MGASTDLETIEGSGREPTAPPRWPARLWVGGLLVAVFWPLNWRLEGLRTHLAFFPLWLGYCLVVDGLGFRLRGHSLLGRSPRAYGALFVLSMPLWWLFEAINLRTRNWIYHGVETFSDLEYALLASLSFSTVLPAVLGSSELCAEGRWLERFSRGPRLPWGRRAPEVLLAMGLIMLLLLMIWPRWFFPFTWSFVFCLTEALAARLGLRSLTWWARRGDWRPVAALSAGVLLCALFWEMWNFYSYPRWIYAVPGVDSLHVFEMPLLGYLGYLPFAWSLFAITQLVAAVRGRARAEALLHAVIHPVSRSRS